MFVSRKLYEKQWVSNLGEGCFRPLGLQYRIGVCTHAVYMYTCTINGGDLSAVDIVYGWKAEAMFFLGSNTITLF